jgi:HAD superfamily hydrolase (TIGR01490 family)
MYHRLALFDLDNTLLPVDSDYEWGEFLCRNGVVDAQRYRQRNAEFLEQYRAGTLDILDFLGFALEPLVKLDAATRHALQERYMDEVVASHIDARAVALVRQHQDEGALCAIVTATNAFVTAPIAEAFGVAHLIASVPEQSGGRFTGGIRGVPCFREGKITRVTAWLEEQGRGWDSFTRTTFYSDSRNDIALLEHVDEPVATNPDDVLRAHATARGWRILELFDDSQIHS